ncbi:hypothetical protein [Magnetococcus sp. PR-3]|uniref:hypothetical protein n=1 Tax=Magnetococcus sp. PR-3 TaxID=3120355 RepID=UPI002FCE12CB
MHRISVWLVLLAVSMISISAQAGNRAEYLAWRTDVEQEELLPRMAREGHLHAMIAMGNCLLTGQDGSQVCQFPSITTGFKYWERAVMSGHHNWLANDLLEMLLRGPASNRSGWQQDWNGICRVAQYVRTHKQLATLGSVQRSGVGLCYLSDYALPRKDLTFGLDILKAEANRGMKDAAVILADIYEQGLYGVSQHLPKARVWRARSRKMK